MEASLSKDSVCADISWESLDVWLTSTTWLPLVKNLISFISVAFSVFFNEIDYGTRLKEYNVIDFGTVFF